MKSYYILLRRCPCSHPHEGALKLNNVAITENMYRTLSRAVTIGSRPRFEEDFHYQKIMQMVGLKKVKDKMKGIVDLQLQVFSA